MSDSNYLRFLAWITALLLFSVGVLNYLIDPLSSHSLPTETGFFPRTTHHSPLSKLHYLATENPEVIYFGSSRVVVGLPPIRELVGGRTVYNAALGGASFIEFAQLARHALAIASPKTIIIGIDFASFTVKHGQSDLDLSLISSNRIEYLAKRIPVDIKHSISSDETLRSVQSLRAFLDDTSYDPGAPVGERSSILGQTTDEFMRRITAARGTSIKAFQIKVALAFARPPAEADTNGALRLLEKLLSEACRQNVVTRVFINPVHALAEDAVRVHGAWPRLENWKADLGNLATRLATQCDLRIIDFSGYNSVTTESVVGLTPTTNLDNYWEASHYKTTVGALILKKIFSPADRLPPYDFGRELRADTVAAVNEAVRREQARYLKTHSDEIEMAKKWAAMGVTKN
jgi:hypothetical protein